MKFSMNGLKFYQWEGETLKILRLYKVNENKKIYECIDITKDDHPHVKVPQDELENNWIKLNPDGVMAFSIVDARTNEGDETPDVTIRYHRIRRNDEGAVHIDTMPYAICRQSVIDIFAMIQQNRYIAGMSISKATCPPEVSYEGCCAYTNMRHNVNVAYYLDDTLDMILECFDQKLYNQELENIKYRSKMKNQVPGYMTTLRELAMENYFMLEVHNGAGICEFPMFKEFDFESDTVNKMVTEYIISNKQEVPIKFYPRPYTKFVDLTELKMPYILIAPDSRRTPKDDARIILVPYEVSPTISFKDYINRGRSVQRAKREIMEQLGWKDATNKPQKTEG